MKKKKSEPRIIKPHLPCQCGRPNAVYNPTDLCPIYQQQAHRHQDARRHFPHEPPRLENAAGRGPLDADDAYMTAPEADHA